MRISGLLGAAIALTVLTPIAPAHADISLGDLMYTDLFRWQGQYGTPTWREILAKFDCTEELTFYLWNVPTPPPPVVIPPVTPPIMDPVFADSWPSPFAGPIDPIGSGSVTTVPVDPIGTLGHALSASAVPEPSTWAMLLLGFAGLGYASYRAPRRTSQAIP
jgi:PEP-CTERM motif